MVNATHVPACPTINTCGMHAPWIAEVVLAYMFAHTTRLMDFAAQQREKRWEKRPRPQLPAHHHQAQQRAHRDAPPVPAGRAVTRWPNCLPSRLQGTGGQFRVEFRGRTPRAATRLHTVSSNSAGNSVSMDAGPGIHLPAPQQPRLTRRRCRQMLDAPSNPCSRMSA